jgi:hypothetical protein
VKDHDKPIAGMVASKALIGTWGEDGIFNIYDSKTLKKGGSYKCHDSFTAGIKHLLIGSDQWSFFTAGANGLIRSWALKHPKTSIMAIEEFFTELRNARTSNQAVHDELAQRSPPIPVADEAFSSIASAKLKGDKEKSSSKLTKADEMLTEKAKELRSALKEMFEKNQGLPAVESLPKEDFVVDLDEIQHRTLEAESEAARLKSEIQRENLIKKVLRERYKAEFCDSMLIPGKKIRSFRKQPRTSKKIEVTNYPLKKLSDAEVREFDHLELQLRVSEKIEHSTVWILNLIFSHKFHNNQSTYRSNLMSSKVFCFNYDLIKVLKIFCSSLN